MADIEDETAGRTRREQPKGPNRTERRDLNLLLVHPREIVSLYVLHDRMMVFVFNPCQFFQLAAPLTYRLCRFLGDREGVERWRRGKVFDVA